MIIQAKQPKSKSLRTTTNKAQKETKQRPKDKGIKAAQNHQGQKRQITPSAHNSRWTAATTADVWTTSSSAELCRCGPQTADVLALKKQTEPYPKGYSRGVAGVEAKVIRVYPVRT
ncbi:hypothetical protein LXL04_038627 [Taraxacum kok-saghyz]